MMKLLKADKEYLKTIGYDVGDFAQIESAANKTTYTLCNGFSGEETKISAKKAIELLGREVYLSGISRSAFHWSALRETQIHGLSVYFDSAKFF